MIKDYTPSQQVMVDQYQVTFMENRYDGYLFNCDKDWNPCVSTEDGKKQYEFCMNHPEEFVVWNRRVHFTAPYNMPASGTCKCGERIELSSSITECPNCGQRYTESGKEILSAKI